VRHPILPRGQELGLPLVSGILLTLSFPPFHLLVPPFVALVPYLVFVAGCSTDRSGAVSVRRGTFWMGVVFYGTLLYWLFAALVYYTWLSLLGYFITVVVLSTFLALAGWAMHFLRVRRGVPFWVSLPLLWTTAEWMRAQLGDLAFPWLGLGHSLTGFPALVGFADIAGARGVTVWLTAINGLLAEWWLEGLRLRWRRWAFSLLALLMLPVGYSLIRWSTLETRPAARVLVVQPNIPEDLKLDREAALDSSRIALGELTSSALAAESDIDLIVWPETAQPYFYERARDWTLWAAGLARRNDVALLFGTLDFVRYDNGAFDYYNAALFLSSEGTNAGLYRKHHLVPIVERVPYVPLSWLRRLRMKAALGWRLPLVGDVGSFLQWFGGFGRGKEEPVLNVNGSGFGVLICYESIFPGLSREYRRAGADYLVNITNDAWFGRERPWWSQTSALYQHPAHLVMRAIENRVGIARSANTGISLFVDPRGRVRQATPLFRPDARIATVETTDGLTVFTRLGDWIGWLCAAGSAFLLLALWWRGRREARRGTSEGSSA
jgi:apolipoprotein N-acyltransferase